MFKSKINWWLGVILVLGLLIRIYGLNTLPYGADADEVSWGYNAYSILKTGRDEYGVRFPLIFKAFGDQKLPVFTYAVVPFVKVFGLNNFAVRFPGVAIGTLLIGLIFLLLRELKFTKEISLLGSLITALSPWTIFLSRIFGYDSATGLFFYTLGIYLALKGIRKNFRKFLIFSALSFALTWYSYIAYRLITPLTLGLLVLVFLRRKFWPTKLGIQMLGVFFITIIPLLVSTLSGSANNRLNQVSKTPIMGMILEIDENRYFCTNYLSRPLCNILDNKIEHFTRTVVYRYIQTFSPNYLFMQGEAGYKFLNVDHYGLFYFMLLPFYLLGMGYYIHRLFIKKASSQDLLLLGGLLITPLAALLVGDPQKVRLSALFPFLIIVIVQGISLFGKWIPYDSLKKNINILTALMIIFNTGIFIFDFLIIHLHKEEFYYRGHDIELMRFLKSEGKNKEVYIKSVGEPIIFYAYVDQTDPEYFQKNVQREPVDELGYSHATDLRNIHKANLDLQKIACKLHLEKKNGLFVTNENLVNPDFFKKNIRTISSENNVHQYHYIYDLKDLNSKAFDCLNQ